jgi:hypothetical protein
MFGRRPQARAGPGLRIVPVEHPQIVGEQPVQLGESAGQIPCARHRARLWRAARVSEWSGPCSRR